MFKVISLDEFSFKIEVHFLLHPTPITSIQKFRSKVDTIIQLRIEYLNYLIHETYSFGCRCYQINPTQKGMENGMLSVESYYKWAVIKRDTNGCIWPPAERIMTEWTKVRAWLKVMLPDSTHPEHKALKEYLRDLNECNDMFLAQFRNEGSITTQLEKLAS